MNIIDIEKILAQGESVSKEESLSWIEKVTKLPNKKLQYFSIILVLSATPVAADDLIEVFSKEIT